MLICRKAAPAHDTMCALPSGGQAAIIVAPVETVNSYHAYLQNYRSPPNVLRWWSLVLPGRCSILRWMPACHYPVAAHRQGIRIIAQMQSCDCGSPRRSQANDEQSIVCPSEMLIPDLSAWVEEGDCQTRFGVHSVSFFALCPVTQRASQPQIGLRVDAAFCQRDDMLHFQARHHQMLWAEAVSAAIASHNSHASFDGCRDSWAIHLATCRDSEEVEGRAARLHESPAPYGRGRDGRLASTRRGGGGRLR